MTTLAHPPGAEPPIRRSLQIYLALMVYLVVVKVVLGLASVKAVDASQDALFAWPLIGVLTLAGAISVWLEPRTGLPGLWEASISSRKRLLHPALVGLGLGVITLALHAFTGLAQTLAAAGNVSSINVTFPASVLFYSGGAIILEAIYRLIVITPLLWLIANVLLRKRGQTQVYWILAVLISAHEPAVQVGFLAGHPELMLVVGIGTYAINVFEAHLLRRYGFLAPLAFRVAYYVGWHVVGSALGL